MDQNQNQNLTIDNANSNNGGYKLISVSDLLSQSWKMFRERFFSFARIIVFQWLLLIGLAVLVLIGFLVTVAMAPQKNFLVIGIYILISLGLSLVIYYYFLRSQISMMYVAMSDQRKTFSEYLALSKGKVGQFFWLLFLETVVLVGATLFFIVPGIIFAYALIFLVWIYLVEGKQGFDAMQQSRKYVYKRWWGIVGRLFLVGLILGVVPGVLDAIFQKYPVIQAIINTAVSFIAAGYSICVSYLLYKSASQTYVREFQPKIWHLKFFVIWAIIIVFGLPLSFIIYALIHGPVLK